MCGSSNCFWQRKKHVIELPYKLGWKTRHSNLHCHSKISTNVKMKKPKKIKENKKIK